MLSNLLSKFMSSEFWREVRHQNSILRRWGDLHFQKRFLNSQLLWRLWCLKGKGASFASLSADGQQQFCEVSIGIISVLELRKWELRGFKEFMKNLHNPSWWVEFEAMSPECKPMSFSTTAGSASIFRKITSLWTTVNHPTCVVLRRVLSWMSQVNPFGQLPYPLVYDAGEWFVTGRQEN